MSYGYPGANSQIENHRVSEESFWPSFTDIMMVIVMVFLLVTVAVILNNWALISKLTKSIDAQKAAIALADNRQVENIDLENKLTSIQQKLLSLNSQFERKQKALDVTQQKLSSAASDLTAKEQAISTIETKLTSLSAELEAEQTRLNATTQKLTESNKKLSSTDKQLLDVKSTLSNKIELIESLESSLVEKNERIVELQASLETKDLDINTLQASLQTNEREKHSLFSQGNDYKEEIKTLSTQITQLKAEVKESENTVLSLKTSRKRLDSKLAALTSSFELAEKTIVENQEKSEKEKLSIQESLSSALAKIKLQEVSIKEAVSKSADTLDNFQKLLAEAQQAITEKDEKIEELSAQQKTGNEQLLSLKGEYDSLDSKYQKLLRPARSSKDKFIVTVSYKKVNGEPVIRLKPSPEGSYKTVSRAELDDRLTSIKEKHGTELYLKVIIPETSGLSYNEAWRFTTNLQSKYDYYFND